MGALNKLFKRKQEPVAIGHFSAIADGEIIGWAAPNVDGTPASVELWIDGSRVEAMLANRPVAISCPLRGVECEFRFKLPATLEAATEHTISVRRDGTIELPGSPKPFRPVLEGRLETFDNYELKGWVWDPFRPNSVERVELEVEGVRYPVVANVFRSDLKNNDKGNGKHGFVFPLRKGLPLGKVHSVRAFVAGTDIELRDSPMLVDLTTTAVEGVLVGISPNGQVTGWAAVKDQARVPASLEIVVDGTVVGTVLANAYHSDLDRLNDRKGHCAFGFRLPKPFLEGNTHVVSVRFLGLGVELDASPCPFTAGTPTAAFTDLLVNREPDDEGAKRPTDRAWAWKPRTLSWTTTRLPLYFRWLDRVLLDVKNSSELKSVAETDDAGLSEFVQPLMAANGLEEMPLVSIVMPTWNRAYVIADAIESVLEQSYPHWELWVCDDGSTDNTRHVVEQFSDPRIHYMQLAKSNGAVARNFGLRRSQGELIAYLDSDNMWHPDFLACAVAMLLGRPECVLTYCGYIDSELSGARFASARTKIRNFDYADLVDRNYIDLNSVVHRRYLLERLGGFDESLPRLQDWDLVLRYTQYFQPLLIPFHLVLYRRNEGWDQVTTLFAHLTELRPALQERAMERLRQPVSETKVAVDTEDARARTKLGIIATDGTTVTAVEVASLVHNFGKLREVEIHVGVTDEIETDPLRVLLPRGVEILTVSALRERVGAAAAVVVVGSGRWPNVEGVMLVSSERKAVKPEDVQSATVDYATVVEYGALENLRSLHLELPVNLPPSMRSRSKAGEGLDKLLHSDSLLTVIRVHSQIFEEVAYQSRGRARHGRILFIDCENRVLRDDASARCDLSITGVHTVLQAADVWVDWELRDNWLDAFTGQAMLEGCLVVTANASPSHALVRGKIVERAPVRDWYALASILRPIMGNVELREKTVLPSTCFGLTHFSDRAICGKLAWGISLLSRQQRVLDAKSEHPESSQAHGLSTLRRVALRDM